MSAKGMMSTEQMIKQGDGNFDAGRHEDLMYPISMYDHAYRGLFVVPLVAPDGRERHVVVRMVTVHEGGMREFLDPVSGVTIGSAGCNYHFYGVVRTLEEFLSQVDSIDVLPEEYTGGPA